MRERYLQDSLQPSNKHYGSDNLLGFVYSPCMRASSLFRVLLLHWLALVPARFHNNLLHRIGGMGLAKESCWLPMNDPDFGSKFKFIYDEHIEGFAGKAFSKAEKRVALVFRHLSEFTEKERDWERETSPVLVFFGFPIPSLTALSYFDSYCVSYCRKRTRGCYGSSY